MKLVALTAVGAKLKADVMTGMYRRPPELLALPQAALEALRDAAAPLSRRREGLFLGEGRLGLKGRP